MEITHSFVGDSVKNFIQILLYPPRLTLPSITFKSSFLMRYLILFGVYRRAVGTPVFTLKLFSKSFVVVLFLSPSFVKLISP